jgi:hypothetical protein
MPSIRDAYDMHVALDDEAHRAVQLLFAMRSAGNEHMARQYEQLAALRADESAAWYDTYDVLKRVKYGG